jgi:hypothetical protein
VVASKSQTVAYQGQGMVLRGLEKVIDVQKMTEEKRSTLKA